MIRDDLGRQLSLPGPPERIVSLVPSLTEYLFFLGAGERVVGVTDFCVAPAAGTAKPQLRGTKNPDVAAIVALRPDLVLL
ncbi:MAG TPA: helical backbone metal receptor, partial [Herpetosiphonaceae bacterium]|nr:helical backbone metal receptor [Herpetosiphonaceae bacterium]